MTRLVEIKLLHTAIWFFLAGCIVAIPVVGGRGHYEWGCDADRTGAGRMRCLGCESRALSVDGSRGTTYRAARGELRHLPAAVAGEIQQDDLWGAVRRRRIVRAGALVDGEHSVAGHAVASRGEEALEPGRDIKPRPASVRGAAREVSPAVRDDSHKTRSIEGRAVLRSL
jgi:hypothetical protein